MSDPYRSADGVSCPRCRELLGGNEAEQLVCPAGCGAWIPCAALAQLMDPTRLPRMCHAPFHRATPLPPTPCLVCRKPLEDLYQGDLSEVRTMGLCAAHGLWLERWDRDELVRRFAGEIEVYRLRQQETAYRQHLVADERPVVVALLDRVDALERTVAHLVRVVDELRRR